MGGDIETVEMLDYFFFVWKMQIWSCLICRVPINLKESSVNRSEKIGWLLSPNF